MATGQEVGDIEVLVQVDIPLDLSDMVVRENARGEDIDATLDPCRENPFIIAVDGSFFRFVEDERERGCGEALFTVDVPKGATGLDIVYRAERYLIRPQTDDVASVRVDIIQEVNLYHPSDLGTKLHSRSDFPNHVGDASSGPEPRPVPFVLPESSQFVVGWYFEDGGPAVDDSEVIPLYGHELIATVSNPSVRFHGVPAADVSVEHVRTAANRDSILFEHHVSAAVPSGLPAGADASLTFTAPNSLSVGYVRAPGGDRVPLSSLMVHEDAGVLELVLAPDLMDAHGPGTYTAVFVGQEPIVASAPLAFLILVLMVFPIPTGIYATRGAREFRNVAVGSYRTSALMIARSMYLWWFVYIVLLGIVILARLWPLIAAWPLELEAVLLHIGFVAVVAAFLFSGLYWRRKLMDVMEEDLEEKRRTNEELERSNQELEQFAYVASHDLQEPLRTISRFTELIKHRYGDEMPGDANEFMDYTVDGAKRMQALVDDLLAFSRVGTQGREFEDVDLKAVVKQVKLGLDAAIQDNKATITQDKLPVIRGDRAQIAQVYQNLLTNAMKFRHGRRLPKIHLGAKLEGKEWVLSVADNGIGIPEDQHDRIFVIFQRLHGREEYEGTGIGLAVVKKIIERHGGRIWVESTPKKGTTFFFTMPPGSDGVSS